jgi:transcriptional regulator with XRE-family HTH domain
MTQEDLAKYVGVTKGAIGNYETDVSSPKDSILIKLMEVLQIDANYVYQDYIRSEPLILKEDEMQLIDLYRNADATGRQFVFEILEIHQKKDTSSKAE